MSAGKEQSWQALCKCVDGVRELRLEKARGWRHMTSFASYRACCSNKLQHRSAGKRRSGARRGGRGSPPSMSGANPLGGSPRSHEVHLAVAPDCPVSAIHTPVWSAANWASAMGAAAEAKVMACASSAYLVGHTAAIPAP